MHHVTSSSLIQRCRQRHHVRISDFLQVRQVTTLGSTLHCLPSMSAQYFVNGVNNRAEDVGMKVVSLRGAGIKCGECDGLGLSTSVKETAHTDLIGRSLR